MLLLRIGYPFDSPSFVCDLFFLSKSEKGLWIFTLFLQNFIVICQDVSFFFHLFKSGCWWAFLSWRLVFLNSGFFFFILDISSLIILFLPFYLFSLPGTAFHHFDFPFKFLVFFLLFPFLCLLYKMFWEIYLIFII